MTTEEKPTEGITLGEPHEEGHMRGWGSGSRKVGYRRGWHEGEAGGEPDGLMRQQMITPGPDQLEGSTGRVQAEAGLQW